jgi:hypothetical protein
MIREMMSRSEGERLVGVEELAGLVDRVEGDRDGPGASAGGKYAEEARERVCVKGTRCGRRGIVVRIDMMGLILLKMENDQGIKDGER